MVWAYALVWFLVTDQVKLLAYRVLDPDGAPLPATRSQDRRPRIAARAYQLYKQRVRGEGQAARDWLEAEREIQQKDAPATPADAPAKPVPDAGEDTAKE